MKKYIFMDKANDLLNCESADRCFWNPLILRTGDYHQHKRKGQTGKMMFLMFSKQRRGNKEENNKFNQNHMT